MIHVCDCYSLIKVLTKRMNRLFLWLVSLDKALLNCYSKLIISGGGTSGGGRLTGQNTIHSKRLFYTFLTIFLPQIPFRNYKNWLLEAVVAERR